MDEFLKSLSMLTDCSVQDEKNQIKMKVIVMTEEHSQFSNEQIHKKHQLKILVTSALKELSVSN